MQFVSLIIRIKQKEIELRKNKTKNQDSIQQLFFILEFLSLKFIQLKKSRDQQIKNIINSTKLDVRFKSILKLRKEIKNFFKKINETKQSLNRVYDFVQNIRKYCEVNTKIFCKLNIL